MGQDIRKTASDILEAIDILESIDKSWKTLTDEQIEKLKNKNSNIIKDLEKRQNRLILLYNGKFGHPMAVRKKPVRNEAEATQMLHYLYDNDVNNLLFAESQGVLGRLFVKKAAATDYNQYYETAELIKDYCRYTISLLEKYVNAKGLIEQLQCDYIKTFADIKNINGDNCKDALYIGDIEEPVESSYSLKKLEEAGYLENLWLKIPFSYNLKSPFVLLIKNSAEDAQEKNAAYIRNIMYRVMCSQPMYSYTFTYYDQSGGRNIGNLNMLSDVINYNAYFLNERLFKHRFQQLELYTTKQEISESLSRFEEYIAGINKVCSDYPNVASYNKACNDGVIATGNIPNRYVFFENICGATDDVERIRKIIENSMRCGISLVICADLSEKSNNASTVEQIKNIPGVDVIEIENEGSSFKYNQVNISGEGTRKEEFIYQYDPCYLEAVDSEFISGFSKALNPDVKLETRFEKLFDDSSWWQKCGDVEIQFPVAVDMQGKLQDLILGNPSYPFGMMCGHAGCGKSSFLHTIINGVIKNYHPLDVQLWLIDYNMVEFAQYIDNTPPHVRFIGLSKSKEYTLSLIDKIYNEYHRRFEIYENSRIASVADYRKLNGEHSWPRIMIVIDEFHVMSDHIKDEPEYKQKLTQIYKEARKTGITILLSDQTCGVGLKGLEDAAKEQINNRLAMQTSADEQKAIFEVSNLEEVPQVQVYEVVMRFLKNIINSDGAPQVISVYTRCKTIYVSSELRQEIAKRSIALAKEQGLEFEPAEVVTIKPKRADFVDIGERIDAYSKTDKRGIFMYLGTPLSMEKYFSFRIIDTYNENVMCISKDNMQLKSLIYHQIECIKRRYEEYDIYVFADENCDTYLALEDYFAKQQKDSPSFKVITDYGDICKNICVVLSEIKRRAKVKGFKKPLYIVWIGLEIIAKVLANYSEQRPDYHLNDVSLLKADTFSNFNTIQSDLESMFDDLFGDDTSRKNIPVETEEDLELYNASDDIKRILGEGGTAGVHSIVLYNTVAALRMTKCTKPDNFNHRIAFSMSPDDAGDFLSRAALIKDAEGRIISGDIAVYDGGVRDVKFMPFILEE